MHAGVLYRAGSKVLLMKRRGDDHHGGTWAFPAGKIEAGEDSLQCAVRELCEETGKRIDNAQQLTKQGDYGDFVLWRYDGEEFIPTLNDEHTAWQWAEHTRLPDGLHPGVAEQISSAFSYAMDYAESARELDRNGYVTIARNPITRAGIFQYAGRSLPGAEDPDKIYNVYRPLEELMKPETLKSMALLPIINDHEMLGDGYQRGPEDRGVHGATGEGVTVEGLDILAPIRIFSRSLKNLIDAGKKGLSLGYRCTFEKIAGEFNGMRYDYIQKDIRGNHLALVNEGRSGTDVLDHHWAFDHFDLALDNKECDMAEEKTAEAKDETEGKTEMSIADITSAISKLLPLLETVEQLKSTGLKDPTVALDADEEEKKKKESEAEDADEDEDKPKDKAEDKDEEEKDAMDAAEVKNRLTALETRSSEKALRAQISATDQLAKRIAGHVGTFDHSAMDEAEVVAYGIDKLKVAAPKGAEKIALGAYLDALDTKKDTVGFAMDSVIAPKQGSLLSKRINGAQA